MQKTAAKSSMIRISAHSHAILHQLARATGHSMQVLVAQAIEGLRRQQFFDQLDEAYGKLQATPAEWEAMQKENEIWETTLLDGLENEKPFSEITKKESPKVKKRK